MKSRTLTFLSGFALLVILPGIVRRLFGLDCFSGQLSDLWSALLFVGPITFCSRKLRSPFVVLWVVVQAGSFELLSSMSRLPTWRDLIYLFDTQFINNTFSQTTFAGLYHYLLFVLGGVALMLLPQIRIHRQKIRLIVGGTISFLLILVFMVHARVAAVTESKTVYAQYNPIHWLIVQAFERRVAAEQGDTRDILSQQLDARRYIAAGKARNVLLIALEGLPGNYLNQSRQYFHLPDSQTAMPLFSQFASRGMILPDFIAHSHQTIRGLYAMLCGDFSKLSWSTPKATLLQNVPERAQNCLPNLLKESGFETHYLQAADLVFMGKDRFMPLIGFDHVHGREWFQLDPDKTYHWGPDDKTFFQQTLNYLDDLRKTKKPWFLTTFTVGTHYPYEVDDVFAAKYKDRKQASVAYLDQALGDFFKELDRRGIFKNTLVIVTADESHGSELGDWSSAWVPAVVFAPEQAQLPKLNKSNYGLIDTTLSVLDYFAKKVPGTPGRSFFRKYQQPRELVSFTVGRLRWLDERGRRVECKPQGPCQVCDSHSLIGPAVCHVDESFPAKLWIQKAQTLDKNLDQSSSGVETLHFASGKPQIINHPWQNQWSENLIGAQNLTFDEQTETQVSMTWKVLKAPPEGARLIFAFKEYERPSQEVPPEIPVLKAGEEKSITFVIKNDKERKSFSFHLLAETPCEIQISDFTVTTKKKPSL